MKIFFLPVLLQYNWHTALYKLKVYINFVSFSFTRFIGKFLVVSLGLSTNCMSVANRDNFTSSFPICLPFISFSCLITVAKTSNTMLNKRREWHPCLVPDLTESDFSFLPLSIMLSVNLSYMSFIMLSYGPSIPSLLTIVIINGCWIFSKAFSASIQVIKWFLFFSL